MRFAIASPTGAGFSWWVRLQEEGHEVLVWVSRGAPRKPSYAEDIGDGLVPKVGAWDDLLAWARQKPAETIVLFDSSSLGAKADQARAAGLHVFGGSLVCDRLEFEREFGFRIAAEAGAQLPPYRAFGSFSEALVFARGIGETPTYFKSDRPIDDDATHGAENATEMVEYLEGLIAKHGGHGKCILQEKIPGVALSTERYWNGRTFVGPYIGIIEHKKFLAGDIGPSTGCAFNAVWAYPDEPELATLLGFEKLGEAFLKYGVPPGLFDMNAIVADGKAYFLEFCARLGYDSEPTAQLLIPNLGDWLRFVAIGGGCEPEWDEDLALSVRLSVKPYPCEFVARDDKASPVGLPINGDLGDLCGSMGFVGYDLMRRESGLVVAGPEGLVGLAAATGRSLSSLAEETLEIAKGLRVAGLQYRNDAGETIAEDVDEIMEAGFGLPASLLR